MKGFVFNIQKFSLHDGPGIRTTVFLKGCPLDCPWCANPESKKAETELMYLEKKCVRCQSCIRTCPQGCLTLADDRIQIDRKRCKSCFACAAVCPVHAMYVEGRAYTVQELLAEVSKDRVFYQKSGGGVTLSGGEPLMQQDFVLEFLKQLKAEGIHTTIETAGYTDPEYLLKIFPYVDLFYMDCKHPLAEPHKQVIGVSNRQIIENMKLAVSKGKEITARIPVIPRFNFSDQTARQYASLFNSIGIHRVHLLPFHQMGLGKWRAMGLDYAYADDKNMDKSELEGMYEILKQAGLAVQIGG